MDELVRCPVCDSQKIFSLEGYEAARLFKCSNCQFIFTKKIPSDNELSSWYSHYGVHDSIPELTKKRYRQILEGFEKFRKTNNVLDVGCGDGFFLDEAKKNGWNVHGTEFTPHFIEACRQKGIQMQSGRLDPLHYKPESFDVIASIEVIEHINYPVKEINNFKNILRKGGILYITTPNFNSLSRRLLKDKWNVIEYPEHLSYYTVQNIHYLLKSCGFRKLRLQTTGISIMRIKEALYKIAPGSIQDTDTMKHPRDHELRENIESSTVLKAGKGILNTFLNTFHLGDTIKATYQKM